jgi:peptide/nickel transport system permease protein
MEREMAVEAEALEARDVMPVSRPLFLDFLLKLRRHPLGMMGFIGVVLLLFVAVFAPWIAPYSPTNQDFPLLQSPTLAHPFGTDRLGRDILSRVIEATRYELAIGLTSVFLGVAIATIVGLVSGYLGGVIDGVMQRIVDAWLAFPGLILLLIISAVLSPSPRTLIIALTIGVIPGTSRVIRGAVLSEKNNAYVEAARVIGASQGRIMFRHIFPQVVAPLIVIISIMIPAIALLSAALSFLGLGLPPPTPSWGGDLSKDAREYFQHAPWMATFPGAAISFTVLSFNMLGDAMRDIFDPRLRGSMR